MGEAAAGLGLSPVVRKVDPRPVEALDAFPGMAGLLVPSGQCSRLGLSREHVLGERRARVLEEVKDLVDPGST